MIDRITPSFRPYQMARRAPCQVGCSVGGDPRGWIGIVAQRGKLGLTREQAYARAWEAIVDRNPFPSVLGRVCPHPCEAECNRSARDQPVSINALERFLGDWAIAQRLPLTHLEADAKPEWIGVIGGGPSGLSFAYQMARRGYRVTVYERREKAGGMLRYGIPDYRLPRSVLDAEIQRIVDLGVEIRVQTAVGANVTLAELCSRHPVRYLAIGAQVGQRLDIPGDDEVWSAPDYLERVSRNGSVALGRNVTVIGGGNTAIDAARTARRTGAEVTIMYRRTRHEMPAIPSEVEEALEEGVRIEFLVAPVSLERRADALCLTVERMELAEPDASGRRRPVPVPGSERAHATDSVIAAISQVPRWDGLEEIHASGWLVVDRHGAVDRSLCAGGDVLGLGLVGDGVLHGRRAAEAVHARLRGLPDPRATDGPGVSADEILTDFYPAAESARHVRLTAAEALRVPHAEVNGGIDEDQMLGEVERCFSCGSCFGCEQCSMFCTALCFTRSSAAAPGRYFTISLDACHECGKCIDVCPCRFLRPIEQRADPAGSSSAIE